ncbi:hypothetical protein P8452_32280 [Trifolium repens]|nr:hypothetical protein P8452_32280 [Trifolium repens]
MRKSYPYLFSSPSHKRLVNFHGEMNSGAPVKRFRNFKINNEPCRYFIGFIIFRSVTSFSESSEVVVITVFRASEFISIQVDRLTGARTRMELMIGDELGSSH